MQCFLGSLPFFPAIFSEIFPGVFSFLFFYFLFTGDYQNPFDGPIFKLKFNFVMLCCDSERSVSFVNC